MDENPGALVRPFRAGRLAGEHTIGMPRSFEAGTTIVRMADVSEFQSNVVDMKYLAWSKAVIFRAMYGTTVDKAWYGGQRRTLFHAGGAQFVGMYQYIVANEDPVAQADALINLLGPGGLLKYEKLIADIEEGTGNQQARWVAWADRINAALHDPPWDYSGANFAAAHGLQPVDWIASYGSVEPAPPHKLWQNTDNATIPGINGPVDCSVFFGTMAELSALAYQGPVKPPVPKGPYRHTIPYEGRSTLADVAKLRGTTVEHILETTLKEMSTFDLGLIGNIQLPVGFPFYTTSP